MLTYPDIDPVALSLGPVKLHWYGVMYLIGFIAFWWLGKIRARKEFIMVKPDEVADMMFYGVLGVVLGGRLGYVLFYNFSSFLDDPFMLFKIWQGGMSFHGGFLGVLLAVWIYQRKRRLGFWHTLDFIAPMIPIGLGAGRIGNFINGELWGKVTDLPWGMVYPTLGPSPRHPSQLYEAFLEGLVLFVLLWIFASKPRPTAAVSALFLMGYGVFRFVVEFVREPDAHIGFIALGWLTMGQVLTAPMIAAGVILMLWAYGNKQQRQAT